MEMMALRILLVFFIGLSALKSAAQSSEFIKPGLLRSMLTISPSKMFSDQSTYFYLHGNFEGYVTARLSFAGDSYLFMGQQSLGEANF